MRILITRPRPDSEPLAQILSARGHMPVIAPLMEVRFHDGPPIALDRTQAILATSVNGVRAFAARSGRRDVALFAVGPQTSEAARETGFVSVFSAGGDATALVDYAGGQLDPAKGPLLHAAGAETAGRMRQALQARGFTVETEVLYDAAPITALPENAMAALRDGLLDAVMLFSPRSAKIFAGLVAEAGLSEPCARLDAYCISAATAAGLAPLAFARVAVAGEPNQDSMLALIPGT